MSKILDQEKIDNIIKLAHQAKEKLDEHYISFFQTPNLHDLSKKSGLLDYIREMEDYNGFLTEVEKVFLSQLSQIKRKLIIT